MSKDLLILYPTGIPVNVTFFIAIYRIKSNRNMKNTLAENMMRFENKNQYQTDKIFF